MDTETRIIKWSLVGAKEEGDVFCVWGLVAQNVACGGGCQTSWKLSKVGHIWLEKLCPI